MRQFLEELNREQLLDFPDDYAKSDSRFANAIKVHFCDPGYDEELDKVNNLIKGGQSNERFKKSQ